MSEECRSKTEPEKVRRIRWMADCVEHVLPSMGSARPLAEAAVTAARAWADHPCDEHWKALTDIGLSAAHVVKTISTAEDVQFPEVELAWQVERWKHYGLPEEGT